MCYVSRSVLSNLVGYHYEAIASRLEKYDAPRMFEKGETKEGMRPVSATSSVSWNAQPRFVEVHA